MNASDGLPPLRQIVEHYGLAARKSLGQNFLFDLNLTARIARAAGPLDGVTIFEIGPGPGGLTRALLAEGAARVIAIERDERCLAALAGVAAHYPGRLEIIAGDALTFDFAAAARALPAGSIARICANLPYNIATPLLTRWLSADDWPPWFDRLVLMFQREVAERIAATPAERKDYGRLGVLCGWRTQARLLFDIPASAFVPPPKVTSTLIELIPRRDPLPCNVRLLEIVAEKAFGQRRKMLRQSLQGLTIAGRPVDTGRLLSGAAIAPTDRAEQVDVAGFVRLARGLEDYLSLPTAASR